MRKKQTEEPTPLAPLPPAAFCDWWNPERLDPITGASVGGHVDAERVWSRKDEGRYVHRTYGMNAVKAWTVQSYRDEYHEWRDLGRPDRELFVSNAAPLSRVIQFWHELREILSKINKPMPRTHLQTRNPLTNKPKEEEQNGAIDF